MAVLDKIKSFFKRPKTTVTPKQPEPATKAVKEETPQAPEKKAGEASQQQGTLKVPEKDALREG